QLLSGLLHFEQPMKTGQETVHSNNDLICNKCEMTYEQFTRVGRFGCAHCYKSFESKLDPILRRVHGGNHSHTGKLPERIGGSIQLKRKIDNYKKQLKTFVENEEFEKAAEL